jgi:Uma2 family endonuclease
MATLTDKPLMTTEEMLALPKNGTVRQLIRGRLLEKSLTRHNRRHSRSETQLAQLLNNWLEGQPLPRGEVLCGEAGFRLRRNPDTTVGIDVAYISAEMAAATPEDVFLIDGAPVLAVEILSPSNQWDEVTDKVQEYLAAGVAMVWVLDPVFRTVQVYRPGSEPEMFNSRQELTGEPHLPGFRTEVGRLFSL